MSTGLQLSLIRLDGDTQARMGDYKNIIEEYARAMRVQIEAELPQRFPPIIVFFDGAEYWLADGFHRVKAALSVGLEEFAADVRTGDRRDALLWAIGSNTEHGMQRTNADKRNAVKMMLQDKEWCGWSDRQIATHCDVSDKTVADARKDLYPSTSEIPKSRFRKGADGRTIDTTNIGKKPRSVEVPKQESLPYAELCARCQRVGAVVGCKACQEMGKEQPAGGETEACPESVRPDHVVEAPKQDAAPASPRRPFDFKPLEGHVEGLRRQIDLLSAFHDQLGADSPRLMHLYRKVDEILFDAVAWNKELMQKEVSV